MATDIHIDENGRREFVLIDRHNISIRRTGENDAEIVIHPSICGRVTVRFAKEPYECCLTLANGECEHISLCNEDDWGNIQRMNPKDWFKEGEGTCAADWHNRIGWGNDEDGHIEIVKVERFGKSIPLDEFKQDVADFANYFEG